MKFSASKIMLSLCVVLLLSVMAAGQGPTCKCPPIPPGSIHTCEDGQAAFCDIDDKGRCTASCNSKVSASLEPMEFTAAVLAKVFDNSDITAERLRKEPKDFKSMIEKILKSNEKGTIVTLQYKGIKKKGNFGLTGIAVDKLLQAVKALHALIPHHMHIPAPVIRP